jgi:vacuolar-type H+-ATPase subunit I/STV1
MLTPESAHNAVAQLVAMYAGIIGTISREKAMLAAARDSAASQAGKAAAEIEKLRSTIEGRDRESSVARKTIEVAETALLAKDEETKRLRAEIDSLKTLIRTITAYAKLDDALRLAHEKAVR